MSGLFSALGARSGEPNFAMLTTPPNSAAESPALINIISEHSLYVAAENCYNMFRALREDEARAHYFATKWMTQSERDAMLKPIVDKLSDFCITLAVGNPHG